MTTQEKFEAMIYDCGVFENDAHAIMEYAKPLIDSEIAEHSNGYRMTWDRPADEYPQPIYDVLFNKQIKRHALAWIEAHQPLAWYKAVFA